MLKFLVACALVVPLAYARPLTQTQKLSDLDELVGQIRVGYGPLEYKKALLGIDLDDLRERYAKEIRETKTNADFYYLMIRFVAEFKDSHFRASLPTDLVTSLGFTTDLIEDKVVIDEIDRTVLPESKFPFAKGDEVVSLGGKAAADVVAELVPYMGQGYELTAKRRATFQFAKRAASKVPAQSGNVVVEVRRGDSTVTESVELTWNKKGTWSDEAPNLKKSARPSVGAMDYDSLQVEESFRCSGNSRIKLPKDAVELVKDPFVAYYYPTARGNVGYLRIPHYSFTDKELALARYAFAVKSFEKNTVGLVIDQDHNCGGSVDWLHRFMGLFMDRPFAPMQFELLANKRSYQSFTGWVAATADQTIDRENYVRVQELVRDTWMNTANFLTTKTSISGEEFRYPGNVRYTKPILILIDELSGSGGDAFPSLMGGYGRAKLLGTRTMGAGGHVEALTPLSNSQVKIDITRSLFYRPDGVAVENNGAVPDISYTTTLNDFKYGHQEYQKFFTEKLLELVP